MAVSEADMGTFVSWFGIRGPCQVNLPTVAFQDGVEQQVVLAMASVG
jgi:hypothetical protein